MKRFLKWHYSRTKMDYDSLHEMTIEELVSLRNSISTFNKMIKNLKENLSGIVEVTITHPDFQTLWLNQHMIPEVLDSINGMIARRNMKTLQERKRLRKSK